MKILKQVNRNYSPNKKYFINVAQGMMSQKLLESENFQNAWDELYKACPIATVFQHRKLITAWYTHYQNDYSPLIVTRQENEKLTGLLTLAIGKEDTKKEKGTRIIGAGKYDAEYQTWLTVDPNDTSFIKSALRILLKKFPRCKVILRYVPSNSPLNWTKNDYWNKKCVLQV